MTILRDATAINDGTTAIMAVSLRNHGDNDGATAVYAVQAPQWYRASGVTGVLSRTQTEIARPFHMCRTWVIVHIFQVVSRPHKMP